MGIEMRLDPETISGQMVVGGFEGRRLPAEVRDALARGRLSGVVLFERNLGSPEEVRALTDEVRSAAPVPPIIAIDHEGGRVQRLGVPFTQWPPARALGQKNDPGLAREVARAMAAELLAAGINANFAPVLDVDSNPANPVIGDRSFGPGPQLVGRIGAAMIAGFEDAGLVSCGKHFPGHGDTDTDSHLALPVVSADRATLEFRELAPFADAVKARVPMIMTAHVKAPALDKYYPATISRAILADLLRIRMGFNGIIISDGLEMQALSEHMPIADAAFSAVRAGCDLLLACSGPEPAEDARQAVAQALAGGALGEADLRFKLRRIVKMKETYLLREPPPRELIPEVVGCERHRELARKAGGGG